jgi:uncharacterized DUF497 family protein
MRGIGLDEVQALFYSPYYLDQLAGEPEQWVAIGWVTARLYTVVFEERTDAAGDYYHLVTLWKSTTAERKKYEESQ